MTIETIQASFRQEARLLQKAVAAGSMTAAAAKRELHRILDDAMETELLWLQIYLKRGTKRDEDRAAHEEKLKEQEC